MDNLEKFIIKNREEFDTYEPSPELWDRIGKREPQSKIRSINWKRIVYQTAAVVLIFVMSYFVQNLISKNTKSDNLANEKEIINTELAKIETYYNAELERKMNEITVLTKDNPEIKTHVYTDLAELDSAYIELKSDLKDNIDNEEVINAMIKNYKLKMEMLEDILYFLEGKNKKNSDNSKKYDI